MMNRVLACVFMLALLGGSTVGGLTAEPRVRIYFSALDKEEKPVLGLTEARFDLRVDGKRAALEAFHQGAPYTDQSTPLALWILIDFNPNVNSAMIKQQADAAAGAFGLFHRDSVIGVKLVSDRSETLEPLSHDPAGLRRALADFANRRAVLSYGGRGETVVVGRAGLVGAAEHAVDELAAFCTQDPSLKGKEVHRAIMILSDANVNPAISEKSLYEKAAREKVFLYPVYVPRSGPYGPWVETYFDLAKRTGGVASILGALSPGSKILPMPRSDTHPNALNFNLIHLARDLNGKYSFEVDAPEPGTQIHLDLRAKVKGVQIRLPRKTVP